MDPWDRAGEGLISRGRLCIGGRDCDLIADLAAIVCAKISEKLLTVVVVVQGVLRFSHTMAIRP